VPDGGVLIHAGDLTAHGTLEELQALNHWLGTLPHRHKLVIAGNHDWVCAERGEAAGCPELAVALRRIRPRLHIFGHIHEAYGQTRVGSTTYANASSCTLRYQPVNPPLVFTLS
jgi:predicted phosphohydrolase